MLAQNYINEEPSGVTKVTIEKKLCAQKTGTKFLPTNISIKNTITIIRAWWLGKRNVFLGCLF